MTEVARMANLCPKISGSIATKMVWTSKEDVGLSRGIHDEPSLNTI